MELEGMNNQKEKVDEEVDDKEKNDEISKYLDQDESNIKIINQYRIIYNHGIYAEDNANFEHIEVGGTKSKSQEFKEGNILEDEDQISRWIGEYYETYSFAFIISCAVFNCLPYNWIIEAADELYGTFQIEEQQKGSKNVSTNFLKKFGAEIVPGEINTYTGKIKVDVIRLIEEQYQEKILKYIWRECPQLRDKIVLWLKKYCVRSRISMSRQAMAVMGCLAYWDYFYFLNNMTKMILHDKNILTDMIIAQVIVVLNKYGEYSENINNLMRKWNKEDNVHYFLVNLFICAELTEKRDILEETISLYIDGLIEELREKRENDYSKNIYDFFSSGMRAYTFYRILVEKIHNLACDASALSEKEKICQLFLRLFAVDVNIMRADNKEDALFVRLCFVDDCKHNIKYKMADLWKLVWDCRSYRQIFFCLMSIYEMKVNKEKDNRKLECFIKRILGDFCTMEMQEDICNKIRRRMNR